MPDAKDGKRGPLGTLPGKFAAHRMVEPEAAELGMAMAREQQRLGRQLSYAEQLAVIRALGYRKPEEENGVRAGEPSGEDRAGA